MSTPLWKDLEVGVGGGGGGGGGGGRVSLQVDRLALSLRIKTMTDLCRVRATSFAHHPSGYRILHSFSNRPRFVFVSSYPHFNWIKLWPFGNSYPFFAEWLLVHSLDGVRTQGDLERISVCSLSVHPGGRPLLGPHQESPSGLLHQLYPQFFGVPPCALLLVEQFVHRSLQSFSTYQHFFRVNWKTFDGVRWGSSILHLFGNSPQSVLIESFPTFGWYLEVLLGDLTSPTRRMLLIERFLATHLPFVETQQHLMGLTTNHFSSHPGGFKFVHHFEGSIGSGLSSHYPFLNIQTKMKKVSNGFWKNKFKAPLIKKAIQQYNIKKKEDWYSLSLQQFSTIHGKSVSKQNMITLLHFSNPEESWEKGKFSVKIHKRSREKYLGVKLKEVFPAEVIHYQFVVFDDRKFVFDYYLPERRLVVEYQGEQHYWNPFKWSPIEDQRDQDKQKRAFCLKNQLDLVQVPYWWDDSLLQLKSFLQNYL